jgi:3-isopropylmalate/(R)-2-methylmalate dehydratase small subunit
MTNKFHGRAWLFGDNVDTGTIISARFMTGTDNSNIGAFCLVDDRPEFSKEAKKNDVLVAGKNFGCGSSREHAPLAVKQKVHIVVAESFARIFFRNAVNIGLYVIELADALKKIKDGDDIEVDLVKGLIINNSSKEHYRINSLPEFMRQIYECDGLYGYIKKRWEQEA